jgi:hypothetical protein
VLAVNSEPNYMYIYITSMWYYPTTGCQVGVGMYVACESACRGQDAAGSPPASG